MTWDELRQRALNTAKLYDKLNQKQAQSIWRAEDYFQGFVGDVCDLAKLINVQKRAHRVDDPGGALAHELADLLWSVIILADRLDVDLPAAFQKMTDDLKNKLDGKLAK
ncbi:MAG: nucleotide pyrophosphohydrolase [Candidatus Nomurabacteria bacterium]|jgi:NTP pyrophosphatase (non-canonical NTP hydrolase)|nr:nucleotide pyrophosphohydrolase [Candidatus Nomurabacteria bacterium]